VGGRLHQGGGLHHRRRAGAGLDAAGALAQVPPSWQVRCRCPATRQGARPASRCTLRDHCASRP
jgi:hypothetical protein